MLRIEIGHKFLLVFCIIVVRFLIRHGHMFQNLLHVGFKTHVNHTICFVQHDVRALWQYQISVFQNVDQTTRCCDDDLCENKICKNPEYEGRRIEIYLATHSKSESLLFPGETTDNGHCSYAQMLTEFDALFFDLLSQFTSRSQNDSVRSRIVITQTDVLGKRLNPNKQRDQERGCFSWTGFGNTDNISVLQSCIDVDESRLS